MWDKKKNQEVSKIEEERRVFRRKQTYKSVLISMVSVVIFSVVLFIALKNAPGIDLVLNTYFNGELFLNSIPGVFKGLLLNILILIFSAIGTAIVAIVLASARSIKSPILFPLKLISTIYTDIFRGVPLIIVIYLIGFGIPGLGIFGRINPLILGTISIITVYSAYVSEVIRSGIEAIHPSQRDAARSLGLSHSKTLILIILPQGIRKVIPALMNDFVAMQKDVGLVSMLGVIDAVRQAQIMNAMSLNYTHYTVAAVLFIMLSFPFIRLSNHYAKKVRQREEKGGIV